MPAPSKPLALLVAATVLVSCGCQRIPVRVHTPPDRFATLDHRSEFLKAHMRDGRLYVLVNWSVDEKARTVSGEGELRAVDRSVVERGRFVVPLGEVALFETNRQKVSRAIVALTVVTGISLAVTGYCIANPKACFGSCPTFYVSDGTSDLLQAEGFSDSVAPSLEERDVDALYRARPRGREVVVRMTNEALETHVVRDVSLLVARRPSGGRVFASPDGKFWPARRLIEPAACLADEGDCRQSVARFDGEERFSRTDGRDLTSRETVDLRFDDPTAGDESARGLVIAGRQTLLSTFLFYQALGYMGRSAGEWLAAMERDGELRHWLEGFRDVLGGIEVLVEDRSGSWTIAGEIREAGPIASDVKVVPLPRGSSGRVRLRMARGQWRLDWVALGELGPSISAHRLAPQRRAAEATNAGDVAGPGPLVTLPGDAYRYAFRLPDDAEHLELFLESRGYYLEWIRDEWMAEENPRKLAALLANPREALRELAPAFAAREAGLDDVFWKSRYARP